MTRQDTVSRGAEDGKPAEEWIHLTFTWSGKPFELDIAESDRYVEAMYLLLLCADNSQSRRLESITAKLDGRAAGKAKDPGSCQREAATR